MTFILYVALRMHDHKQTKLTSRQLKQMQLGSSSWNKQFESEWSCLYMYNQRALSPFWTSANLWLRLATTWNPWLGWISLCTHLKILEWEEAVSLHFTSFLGSAVRSLLLTMGSSLDKIGPWLARLRPVTGLGEHNRPYYQVMVCVCTAW